MKIAGIIGGFGPEGTSQFYLSLIDSCYKKTKDKRPPLLIWNAPFPYKIEKEFLLFDRGGEKYIPYLTQAARILEKAGVDFLVLPCNSLHIFIKQIKRAVAIPVLSIIEETVLVLKHKRIKRIGLLATAATLEKKLYQPLLKEAKIDTVVPSPIDQAKLGHIINKIVRGKATKKDRLKFKIIAHKLKQKGARAILLTCTDLPKLSSRDISIPIYDTVQVLAEATAKKIITSFDSTI